MKHLEDFRSRLKIFHHFTITWMTSVVKYQFWINEIRMIDDGKKPETYRNVVFLKKIYLYYLKGIFEMEWYVSENWFLSRILK